MSLSSTYIGKWVSYHSYHEGRSPQKDISSHKQMTHSVIFKYYVISPASSTLSNYKPIFLSSRLNPFTLSICLMESTLSSNIILFLLLFLRCISHYYSNPMKQNSLSSIVCSLLQLQNLAHCTQHKHLLSKANVSFMI